MSGDGSYQYVLTGPRSFTSTLKQRTTPASYPAIVTDAFSIAHPNPRFRMPNGNYTVLVRYFDPLVQLWPNAPVDAPPGRCVRPHRCL